MVGKYERCPICKDWNWSDTHRCNPIWEARQVGDTDDDDWRQVYASDAEEAAEKFCEQYDSDCEYTIVRNGEAEIEVRKLGEMATTVWEITAETVPQYSAWKKK